MQYNGSIVYPHPLLAKKMNTEATLPIPPLPADVIEEILLKLPVRCLLRLKCVCKSWFSLISNPQFAKSHYDLAAAPTHRLLLKFSDDWEANSVDTDTPLHDDSAEVVFKIPNPSPAPIPKPGRKCRVDVVGSCRGFLLLTAESSNFIYFVIWNPSTGMQKRFKKVSAKLPYLFGIGYDSSTDDYAVVTVTFPPLGMTEVHCFSSKTNSWSRTLSTVPYVHLGNSFAHGSFLNGALHWLVRSYDRKHRRIIAFDVMERRLSEILLPDELKASYGFYHLRVMGGCLCLCFEGNGTVPPQTWMMKEYKVRSSWTKSFDFDNPYSLDFLPICFTRNGEILGHDSTKKLVRLNDEGKLLEHRTHWLPHCGVYRESLLSLPDDSENFTK